MHRFALLFRLRGVRQVSRSDYESCDLEGLYIRQWAPNQRAGDVTVWVEPGGVYYFIDSVVGGCLDGTKLKVCLLSPCMAGGYDPGSSSPPLCTPGSFTAFSCVRVRITVRLCLNLRTDLLLHE